MRNANFLLASRKATKAPCEVFVVLPIQRLGLLRQTLCELREPGDIDCSYYAVRNLCPVTKLASFGGIAAVLGELLDPFCSL